MVRSLLIAVAILLPSSVVLGAYSTIPVGGQAGTIIQASSPSFAYAYNPRAEGADDTPSICGDAGYMSEYDGVYASFFGDTSTNGEAAEYVYSLVSEGDARFDTVTIESRASIWHNAGTVAASYRIDGGAWTSLFSYSLTGDYKPVDVLADLNCSTLDVRYTIARTVGTYAAYSDQVQLFRSSGPQGQPGDFTYRISGTLVPEPGTISLLVLSSMGMLWRRRA